RTFSNHTVCQMPVTAVYQMPDGSRTCLPRGCNPLSVGSHTATTISCPEPGLSAEVMSNQNVSYPPSCFPTGLPLTQTSARRATAPTSSRVRPPGRLGAVKVRRYHNRCSGVTGCFTPESADSTGNGTSSLPSNCEGLPSSFGLIA